MTEPPVWVVRRAELVAAKSSCAKSRRGVVLFDRRLEERRIVDEIPIADDDIYCGVADLICIAEGYNRPPGTEFCDGSERCRESCGKRCIHAEMMAILDAGEQARGCDLVHIKVRSGAVVAGGGPSCWQCSKHILEAGLAGVWLYEEVGAIAMGGAGVQPRSAAIGEWRFYTARAFHEATLDACQIHRAVSHG